MPSLTLSKSEKESKGRNGWFTPAKAEVLYGPHDTVCLEIWSKRETGEPPIDLYLTVDDAVIVGRMLMSMATDAIRFELSDTGEKRYPKPHELYTVLTDSPLEIHNAGDFDGEYGGKPEDFAILKAVRL